MMIFLLFSVKVNVSVNIQFPHFDLMTTCHQGLKCRKYRPIYRRYFVYRALTKRYLKDKVVCWKNRKKSANIADISAKYRNLDDISVEISTRGRHARGRHFSRFFGRYIADISKISSIYRRYFRYIGRYIGICFCG